MVVENYQINEPFLKDAFGTFYKGFEIKTEKSVIIHCVNDELATEPEFTDIYNATFSEVAQLNIPNFAKSISGGNTAEILYTVYPDADLIPLKNFLSQNNTLSIFDAPNLLEKISQSIRALHIEGVLHGTLSPESIFVDNKLERFEIFNAGSEKLIRYLLKKYPGNLQKTLSFLSPEILSPNTALQRQSDVYSLGVLFYTLLVGNTPWPEADLESLPGSRDSIIPPSLHRLEIPDFLDSLILDALEKKPEARSANLSLFLNSLTEAKSNIIASFTPTSALIYDRFDEPSPTETEENQTADNEDDGAEEIKPDTHSDRIENKKPEEPIQNTLKVPLIQSDEPQTSANLENEDIPTSQKQESQIIANTGEVGVNETKNFTDNEANITSEEGQKETLLEDKLKSSPDSGSVSDHRKQLLNHENDFFTLDLPESPIVQNDSDDAPLNKEKELSEPEKESANFKNGLSKIKPDANVQQLQNQSPAQQTPGIKNDIEVDEPLSENTGTQEIYTDDSFVEQELKFKTHQTLFPILQINELDDRLSFKSYRDSQKAKEVPNKVHTPKSQKTLITKPSTQQPGAQQIKTVGPETKYRYSELDDFDEKTATATEEFLAETDNKEKRSKTRFMRSILQKVGIPAISILSIYLLVLFMIDLGISDGIEDIKKRIQHSSNKTDLAQTNLIPNRRKETAEQNNLLSNANPVRTQNQNFNPINTPTQSINTNIQDIAGLRKNPLLNLNPNRNVTNVNQRSTNQIRQNSTPPPTRTLLEPELTNEAQLIVAVRNNTTPLVANIYLDGKLYGKTNNQGILSIPNLQKNQPYLLRIGKSGFEMFAREINLNRAGIETIDANLTETQTKISSTQLDDLRKQRNRQKKSLTQNNRPKNRTTQEEFGTVNILLNNTEPISDAFIRINGQPWQGSNYEAPAEIQLPSGTYEIEIQKDGYISAPQSYTLDLLNGDYKTISFILTTF